MVVHRVGSEGSGSRVGCVSRAAWPGVRASRKYLLGDVTPEAFHKIVQFLYCARIDVQRIEKDLGTGSQWRP